MNAVLKEIADVRLGYQPKGKVKLDPSSPFRIIQIKDFDEDLRLNTDGLQRFEPESRDPSSFLIEEGDVLFLARGHRNWAVSINEKLDSTVPVAYFFMLRLTTGDLLPSYVAWYLNQQPAQLYLQAMARRGSHMPSIPKSAFVDLPITIPSIDIQQTVVELSQLAKEERRLASQIALKREQLLQAVSLKVIVND